MACNKNGGPGNCLWSNQPPRSKAWKGQKCQRMWHRKRGSLGMDTECPQGPQSDFSVSGEVRVTWVTIKSRLRSERWRPEQGEHLFLRDEMYSPANVFLSKCGLFLWVKVEERTGEDVSAINHINFHLFSSQEGTEEERELASLGFLKSQQGASTVLAVHADAKTLRKWTACMLIANARSTEYPNFHIFTTSKCSGGSPRHLLLTLNHSNKKL